MKKKKIVIQDTDLIDRLDLILFKICNCQDTIEDNDLLKEFFYYYFYKKAYLNNKMFPYISEHNPGLTLHNLSHIRGVLKNIHQIIKDRLKFIYNDNNGTLKENKDFNDTSAFGFDFFELYYLLMATIYHDAGLMFGRKEHANHLKWVLDIENDYKVYGDMIRDIYNIASAHSGDSAIEKKMINKMTYSPNNTPINQHNLAAVLRLADEFHEGLDRTNIYQIQNFIDDKDIIYHFFSSLVKNITFDSEEKKVILDLIIKRFDSKFDTADFKNKLLNFIIDRIKKYHKEILYCHQFDCKQIIADKLQLDLIYINKSGIEKEDTYTIRDDNDFELFKKKFVEIFKSEFL